MDIVFKEETTLMAKRRLEKGYKARRDEVVGRLFEMIVLATPVRDGFARGGWRIGSAATSGVGDTPDPDGKSTIAQGLADLRGIHVWGNVVISNGEPHVPSL